ncbi:hypothetical protein AVEN_37739-1 [Araneus ventricosus]|uniref:Uncharacterized protein n=1 Tax=Araneus ventricosus TaxID=182803 RepID=A0A4Y2BVI1_ARAVE|nr:hypothetical protein AVEN_37739-1 [Araneus ventricosus]
MTDLPERSYNKRAVKKSTDSCPLFKKSLRRGFDSEHVLNKVFSAGEKNVEREKTIVCGLVVEILRCDRDWSRHCVSKPRPLKTREDLK